MLARQRCGRACAERTRIYPRTCAADYARLQVCEGVLQYNKPLSWSLLAFRVSKMESKDRERG